MTKVTKIRIEPKARWTMLKLLREVVHPAPAFIDELLVALHDAGYEVRPRERPLPGPVLIDGLGASPAPDKGEEHHDSPQHHIVAYRA